MAKASSAIRNWRHAGGVRVKSELRFLEPYGFRSEEPRAVVAWVPGGRNGRRPISLTRDYFPRTKAKTLHGKPLFDRSGDPKLGYESGVDLVAVHQTRLAAILCQVTLTPFVKLVRDPTGKSMARLAWRDLQGGGRVATVWDLHAAHGEPPFPHHEMPFIPGTVEARDEEAERLRRIGAAVPADGIGPMTLEVAERASPTNVFSVEHWLESPDLQRRYPIVTYLASYGHTLDGHTVPVRLWWRSGKRTFPDGQPPEWMPLQQHVAVEAGKRTTGVERRRAAAVAEMVAKARVSEEEALAAVLALEEERMLKKAAKLARSVAPVEAEIPAG